MSTPPAMLHSPRGFQFFEPDPKRQSHVQELRLLIYKMRLSLARSKRSGYWLRPSVGVPILTINPPNLIIGQVTNLVNTQQIRLVCQASKNGQRVDYTDTSSPERGSVFLVRALGKDSVNT